MNNNNNTLTKLLEQEIILIEQLNTLLQQEKTCLSTRQFSQLESISQEKQNLSEQLELSAQKRNNIDIKNILNQATQDEATKLNQLNHRLAEQLSLCKTLNMVNGQVIAHSLYARQEIVNLLSETKDPTLYTAKGAIKSAPKKNHHQKA